MYILNYNFRFNLFSQSFFKYIFTFIQQGCIKLTKSNSKNVL